ncbi:DUF192 domain-containing protein [Paenibacillus sp. GD4]|uniref:DUF192 domain-containing protein n=1 Tax=Paenibacillus sp. GD4 TaxID=3068890 RepID=UPI0027965F66|nr:DUF192 domain-containing protein [Paenibacillus sp. GD4]MDQ1911070.1 DUF192 domain-containing protein [Paenibacillus sp. GD4]
MMKLVNRDTGELLAGQVRMAHTFMQRLIGLMFTKTLEPGTGLHLQPCRQVHTFGMKYAIDVLYLNAEGRIIAMDQAMTPGKVGRLYPDAVSAVELPAGWLGQTQTRIGQAVRFEAR